MFLFSISTSLPKQFRGEMYESDQTDFSVYCSRFWLMALHRVRKPEGLVYSAVANPSELSNYRCCAAKKTCYKFSITVSLIGFAFAWLSGLREEQLSYCILFCLPPDLLDAEQYYSATNLREQKKWLDVQKKSRLINKGWFTLKAAIETELLKKLYTLKFRFQK